MKQILVLSVCALILFGATGCGEKVKGVKTEYIDGVVKLDGKIVPEGTSVRFLPVTEGKGEPAGGYTDKNGVYKLSSNSGAPEKGALEGEYKIVLSKMETTEYEEGDPKAPRDNRGDQMLSTSKEILPKIYTDKKTTPLTYTVVKGKQKFDLELSSTP